MPRYAIHAGGGFALKRVKPRPERVGIDVVEERGELSASSFAFFRTHRSSAWVTRARLCVRCACFADPAFLLVPGLGSTGSAAGRPALFVGFAATLPESPDFSGSCIGGYGSCTFPPRTTRPNRAYGRSRDLPVPAQGASIDARVLDHAGLAGRSR